MTLPRIDKETGRPYISYSQYKLWNSDKSFNLGVEGKLEYIQEYMLGREFPDAGWGQFGHEVEDYICKRANAQAFTEEERKILHQITPLGQFQVQGLLNMGDYDIKVVLDDATPDFSKIRDYKTASKRSSQQYFSDDYIQLDLYGEWVYRTTGKYPELEVCIIERGGNCMFGKGRGALFVKGEIWYHTRQTNVDRVNALLDDMDKTAKEISEYYQGFAFLNNL